MTEWRNIKTLQPKIKCYINLKGCTLHLMQNYQFGLILEMRRQS